MPAPLNPPNPEPVKQKRFKADRKRKRIPSLLKQEPDRARDALALWEMTAFDHDYAGERTQIRSTDVLALAVRELWLERKGPGRQIAPFAVKVRTA